MKTKTPEELKEEIYKILDENLRTDEEHGCPEVIILGQSVNQIYHLMKEYTLSLLPSDEEIDKANEKIFNNFFLEEDALLMWDTAFKHCAKWLKQQILNKLK